MSRWLRGLRQGLRAALSSHDLVGGVVEPHDELAMLERSQFLRAAGANIADTATVGRVSILGRPDHVEIGENCQVQHSVWLVTDGWAALPAPGKWSGTRVRILESSVVFRGSWIMPGVTIGPSSIILPGSVVSRNIPPGYIVMGQPARPVRDLDLWAERCQAMRETNPEDFVRDPGGWFGVHANVAAMVADWLDVIRAKREQRGGSMEGLVSPEDVRRVAEELRAMRVTQARKHGIEIGHA